MGSGLAIALPFTIAGIDPAALSLALWAAICLTTPSVGLAPKGRAAFVLAVGPLVASAALGGPAAVAWVALLGTFEARELRGGPWYGVLLNHWLTVIAYTTGALVIAALRIVTWSGAAAFVDFATITAGAMTAISMAGAFTIETAERYFAEWTAGRYSRIIAPLVRQIEAVEHRDGTQVAIGDLSTGTAQQLYLAVRFGLVEHFSEAAEPLPIVMDDILVNFDDERAALAARSIECLAERHQVIYFTCHPDTPLAGGLEVELDRLETVQQAVAAQ